MSALKGLGTYNRNRNQESKIGNEKRNLICKIGEIRNETENIKTRKTEKTVQ